MFRIFNPHQLISTVLHRSNMLPVYPVLLLALFLLLQKCGHFMSLRFYGVQQLIGCLAVFQNLTTYDVRLSTFAFPILWLLVQLTGLACEG